MNFCVNLHSITVFSVIQSYWLSRNYVRLGDEENYLKLFLLMNNIMMEH